MAAVNLNMELRGGAQVLDVLPAELWVHIMQLTTTLPADFMRLALVCRTFYDLIGPGAPSSSSSLWAAAIVRQWHLLERREPFFFGVPGMPSPIVHIGVGKRG
jgi:hypothetical protein